MSQIPTGTTLDRGFHGEQSMGFFLGERGYYFVEGPSGAGGHAANAHGFDGIAYNPHSGHLIIYDNKAYQRQGKVAASSALTKNLNANLDNLIARVRGMGQLPDQAKILDLLQEARASRQPGSVKTWPAKVELAISNAGGRSTGVTQKLTGLNIRFIDYSQAPKPSHLSSRLRSALSSQNVAAALGIALGEFFQWLGDIGIQREVERRVWQEEATLARIQADGNGVLIVISMQEWELADDNGRRGRALLSVILEGGRTKEDALANWRAQSRLLQGAAPGWRTFERYAWIPPL